uniref:Uncharacterized protein n=1 Tax=Ciona savignyi TaxID=51511 RepID=H2Y515_CIOSA
MQFQGGYPNNPMYDPTCNKPQDPTIQIEPPGQLVPQSAKGNYPQAAPCPNRIEYPQNGSESAQMPAPCAPNVATNNPIAHVFPNGPNGPTGDFGSSSGYETLSNNSCSPYTSPDSIPSINPGSCDHTGASIAPHPDPTYSSPQSSMVTMVQSTVLPIIYSAPSNDSGHGSEYLASPTSHGMVSSQGDSPQTPYWGHAKPRSIPRG